MIILILEKTMEDVLSAKKPFYKRFPESTRKTITSGTSLSTIKTLEVPPFLQSGWLVEAEHTLDLSQLSTLGKLGDNNVILFTVETKKQLSEIREKLIKLKIGFKFIDNSDPGEENITGWILKTIKTDKTTAKYIYNRYHGYLPKIVLATNSLIHFDRVTKQIVCRYAPPAKKYAMYQLADYLVGKESRVSYKDAVKIVQEYQYSTQSLVGYLMDTLDEYIEVFTLISLGNLTAENAVQFKNSTTNRLIKDMNSYHLLMLIDSYNSISFDRLFYLKFRLSEIKKDRFSLFRLIFLLKTT